MCPPRSPAAEWIYRTTTLSSTTTGRFEVDTVDNTGFFSALTAGATFNNYGTFVKSGDSGTAEFMDFGGVFNNSGSVVVDQGGLSLTGGASSGSYTGAAGTTLSFGGQTFAPTSSIAGDTISFSGGDAIAGSYSAQTATIINYGFGEPDEFTGTVTSVGSLTFVPDIFGRGGGIADFSPSSGPTTLTVSSLTLTDRATLIGSDSFVVTQTFFTWVDGGTLAGPSGTSLTAAAGSRSRWRIRRQRASSASWTAAPAITAVMPMPVCSATVHRRRSGIWTTTRSSTTTGPSRSTPSTTPVFSRR